MFGFFSRPRTVPLGSGVSGSVDLVHSGASVYAVKHYQDREAYESRADFRARALCEYNVLATLHHPNVVRALRLEVGWDGSVRMHMEAGSANLAVLLRERATAARGREPSLGAVSPELQCIWRQLLLALQYLHHHNWCHRDIKLENLVMVGRTLKVVDFATAAACNVKALGLVGSPRYAAPETSAQIHYAGAPADVWAAAIVLVFFASARFPWKGAVWSDARYTAFAERGDSAVVALLEPGAAQVARRALAADPDLRPSVDEILALDWGRALRWCHDDVSCGATHSLGQ